jgi:hypothetical protein
MHVMSGALNDVPCCLFCLSCVLRTVKCTFLSGWWLSMYEYLQCDQLIQQPHVHVSILHTSERWGIPVLVAMAAQGWTLG